MSNQSSSDKGVKLTDLIERLEKLTGPDREVDVAIHKFLKRKIGIGIDDDGCEYLALRTVPEYTKSIDAALTLVPEGWFYSVGREHPDFLPPDDLRLFSADVMAPVVWGEDFETKMPEPHIETFSGRSANGPAIALCIAALRAREDSAHD